MQGMKGIGHLRAPARQEHMQGMRVIEHLNLRSPAPTQKLQGMPRCRVYLQLMILMSERSEGSCVEIKVSS